MQKEKRTSVRAIIFKDDKIVSMYREREGRIFYTFPGGGLEGTETEEQCVIREVYEEFGITIKPIKKVYISENQISVSHYYVCKWISGKFGTGKGEEFNENRNNGVYIPKLIKISEIPVLPLKPTEVAEAFYNDYLKNNTEVRNDVKFILSEIK